VREKKSYYKNQKTKFFVFVLIVLRIVDNIFTIPEEKGIKLSIA
jgi:hypothetical protein